MRLRATLGSAVLIASIVGVAPLAWAASDTFDRAAYLAQAAKAGPDEFVARNFLATAAAAPRFFDEKSLLGPAAPAVIAWLGSAREHCTPPGTEIELECRTRGIVDAAQMVYVESPDRARGWAVVTLHTSPDSGNVGYERILLFSKGANGYAFHAVADAIGYQPGNFADDGGAMTYVGFTSTPGEAMEGKGPRQRFRIVGLGTTAKAVPDGVRAARTTIATMGVDEPDVAAAIAAVRNVHRGVDSYGLFSGKDPAPMRAYMTESLIKAWLTPDPAAIFDGNPLLGGRQSTQFVSILSATPHDFVADRGGVRVVTRVVAEGVSSTETVDWLVRRVKGHWFVDDNVFYGHSLRWMLSPTADATPMTVRAKARRALAMTSTDDYNADHNGSVVLVSPRTGTISYLHASRGMMDIVDIGTVLFRGRITRDGIAGTAYTFKRGCPPAPYSVTGHGYTGSGSPFVIIGHPPIRATGSCAVVGYGDNSNSVLHFEPNQEGDI